MVDFEKLITPEMCERAAKRLAEHEAEVKGRGVIKGVRTKPTGSVVVVEVSYEITEHDGKDWIKLLNGPTGYEGMPFNNCPEAIVRQVPWNACNGCHAYDKLVIPASQIRKIWRAHPELQTRSCRRHGKEMCACRQSSCCSKFTHGCDPQYHKFFDPDFNGA